MITPDPTANRRTDPIAIVGAGLSGLACAQTLAEAGHCVHVFDKSRGPSGRMSTRRSSDGDMEWQCDHGAQYFMAHDAEFRRAVLDWQQAGAAQVWQGRIGMHDGRDFAAQDCLFDRFVGLPRMTSPAAYMVQSMQMRPQPVRFQWQTTIQPLTSADAGPDGWLLHSPEHGTEPCRYQSVLVAVPAPQAAPLVAAVAPEAALLSRSALMQPCWSVMVRCPRPVPLPVDGCIIEHGPLRWIARDSSKPGRSGPETWLLHAGHHWSEAHLEDDAASVAATLLEAFAQLGGPDPASVQATAHRWRYADTATPLNVGAWWDAATGLGMCGDWMHSGSVEGAWLSGRTLARHVHTALHTHAD
ncbi:MAG: NAD(P)-binding protein [Comamonas sp.]|uniref:NAD(P)/FAD-dependent oxidoreductase n=1 Tax=Comamonas sp. TaxID=34028 RepID=UPI00284C0142|nr:NAD(P)-binding protein [Comamonas sp.]MDR3067648.1 NAD(P)-binding protein [Comamonas sp.]